MPLINSKRQIPQTETLPSAWTEFLFRSSRVYLQFQSSKQICLLSHLVDQNWHILSNAYISIFDSYKNQVKLNKLNLPSSLYERRMYTWVCLNIRIISHRITTQAILFRRLINREIAEFVKSTMRVQITQFNVNIGCVDLAIAWLRACKQYVKRNSLCMGEDFFIPLKILTINDFTLQIAIRVSVYIRSPGVAFFLLV